MDVEVLPYITADTQCSRASGVAVMDLEVLPYITADTQCSRASGVAVMDLEVLPYITADTQCSRASGVAVMDLEVALVKTILMRERDLCRRTISTRPNRNQLLLMTVQSYSLTSLRAARR